MLEISTDASSKNEKPYCLIGFVVLEDNSIIKKDVEEVDLSKEVIEKRINETIYLELRSVVFALEYLANNNSNEEEIKIYNDNTTVIYILNRLFRNKRKITKIEQILKAELKNAKDMISRIGTVKFKYINSKDNKAHKTLENYRKACEVYTKFILLRKWEEDIKDLKIENINEEEFIVTTIKGNKFRVNLENNMCTCKYFYYNRETCKHIIACKRYK
ncbi:SWIM zinc finger [Clostridium collagenovorans DSM 3089]|uniref:SWIM zinc finger n=1 Tax=Clostridium collagenovorans DSM 3089 TaxID=1121306 RepID=A0A1M5XM96_9CLOT|nr:SWIM zinc finger family protein [Clostridium collagenovorans]SHI00950.1 SWIM zinc finger [Clostridium collagenovorans DSM 3089]